MGVATAVDRVLYLADEENSTIRKVTTLAGAVGTKGSADGPGATARFYHPGSGGERQRYPVRSGC